MHVGILYSGTPRDSQSNLHENPSRLRTWRYYMDGEISPLSMSLVIEYCIGELEVFLGPRRFSLPFSIFCLSCPPSHLALALPLGQYDRSVHLCFAPFSRGFHSLDGTIK